MKYSASKYIKHDSVTKHVMVQCKQCYVSSIRRSVKSIWGLNISNFSFCSCWYLIKWWKLRFKNKIHIWSLFEKLNMNVSINKVNAFVQYWLSVLSNRNKYSLRQWKYFIYVRASLSSSCCIRISSNWERLDIYVNMWIVYAYFSLLCNMNWRHKRIIPLLVSEQQCEQK